MRKLPILRGLAAMLLAGGVALAVQTPASGVSAAVPPDISLTNVKAHLQQFQNIANSNGGNRRSTGSGYDASVSYVVQRLTAAGYDVVQQACTSGCSSGAGPNVIADWPGGDPDQVLMLGAHLDGVSAGPGINDNGSGSGTLLEVALTLAAQNPTMDMHVRFAWWTDEEQGLNGSQFYANRLSSTERARIKGYLNFDMVASTNAGYFINRISSSLGQTLKAYYDSIGVPTEENTEGAGRSDDASFNAIGVQTSGVAAGASYRKTTAQAQKWGGTAGQSYDPCYHQSCDTINNISDTVLNRSGDAAAYALWTLAVGTPASNDFSIAASPGSGSVIPGGSVNTTINTTVTSGNAQTVNLTASGVPNGVTAAFNPSTITSGSSSTLTLNVSAGVAIGTYIVTVTGTGADATHTTTYALTVTGAPSGCEGTNGTDVSIPDNTTVESSIPIAGCSGNASATATVEVHIAHTYIGDLVVSLVAPDGTAYPLHNRTGGSADNIDLTYTVDLSSEVADGTWRLRAQDAATYDTGTIDTWTLDLSGGPTPPVCGGTNGDNVTVPDNSTVTSTIAVSGCTGNASSSSKVEVHIVHTYIGDLVVTLVAPDGSAYSLHNRSGGSTNDINETYTVDLSSEARNGTWTLRVQDTASFDSGNIDSWTLML